MILGLGGEPFKPAAIGSYPESVLKPFFQSQEGRGRGSSKTYFQKAEPNGCRCVCRTESELRRKKNRLDKSSRVNFNRSFRPCKPDRLTAATASTKRRQGTQSEQRERNGFWDKRSSERVALQTTLIARRVVNHEQDPRVRST